jgi:S-adenosylmethionine decarboxylase
MNGTEWIVEAYSCDPTILRDISQLQELFGAMTEEIGLHAAAPAQWKQFPMPGGVTGMLLLSESHLTIHTFPEFGSACLNLFCCRHREDWDFDQKLREHLQADHVVVRKLERNYALVPSEVLAAGDRL